MNFLLGADPEMFLVDAAGGLVSSIGKIGGSKEEPLPLPVGEGFAVQEDNVAIEFNIPPARNAEEFVDNIHRTTDYLRAMVGRMNLNIATMSAASFPVEQLNTPQALHFGCDPDYNAWTGRRNPKPKASDKTLRSCGGHVHIGADLFQSEEDIVEFIKYCDLYLGVPSVLKDDGELRKKLYGKAGAFRYKPYGCEYRSLSNFWVFDRALTAWVYTQVDKALEAFSERRWNTKMLEKFVVPAINNNDKVLAEQIVQAYYL